MERSRSRLSLGGTRVDVWSRDDLLAEVEHRLLEPADRPLFLASANLDHISHFGRRASRPTVDFDEASVEWLVLLDGVPLVWRSRRLLDAPVEQLAGSDLLGDLFGIAARGSCRVGVFGGAPDTHELLREVAAVSYPGLHLVECWAPTRDELSDPSRCRELAEKVSAQDVDLLVVGLGKPRQEAFLAEHGLATRARVAVAFGAAIDFLAGRVERAPVHVRQAGLEWFWRLAHEPRRLARRYLVAGPPGAVALVRDSRVLATELLPTRAVPVTLAPALTVTVPAQDRPVDAAARVLDRRALDRRLATVPRFELAGGRIPSQRTPERRVGQDRRVPLPAQVAG